jgi:hypothetical protein
MPDQMVIQVLPVFLVSSWITIGDKYCIIQYLGREGIKGERGDYGSPGRPGPMGETADAEKGDRGSDGM